MHCVLHSILLIDFWSTFAPTLDPRISKNRAPAAGRARFYKNRLSKLTSIFDPILDVTLPHFGIQNPPKSFQKSTPRAIKKLINFGIDFYWVLAPFWGPSWSHVGQLSRPKTAQEASKTPPRRLQDAAPGLVPAHGVQSPIP